MSVITVSYYIILVMESCLQGTHLGPENCCSKHAMLNVCNYANSKVTLLWNSSSYKPQINKLLAIFLTIPRSFWGISKRYVKTENVAGKLFQW